MIITYGNTNVTIETSRIKIRDNHESRRRAEEQLPSGQPTGVGEAVASKFADYDVIEELDAEDFAGFAGPVRHLDVLRAGGWIT